MYKFYIMSVLEKLDTKYLHTQFVPDVFANLKKYILSELSHFDYIKIKKPESYQDVYKYSKKNDYYYCKTDRDTIYYIRGYFINTIVGKYWLPVHNFNVKLNKKNCMQEIPSHTKKIKKNWRLTKKWAILTSLHVGYMPLEICDIIYNYAYNDSEKPY